jgi:long-chain acyl-CoA synthetase
MDLLDQPGGPGVLMGSHFVSGRELTDRAARVAAGLKAFGVRPGVPVAVLARNDALHLEVALAAAQLGTSVLPINWRWTGEEIRFILTDSKSAVIVGHTDLLAAVLDAIPAGVTAVWATPAAFVADAYKITAHLQAIPPGAPRYDDWLAGPDPGPVNRPEASSSGLFYTSGTTGRPKGVVRFAPTPEQVAQRHQVLTTCHGIVPGARMLITTPLHHIFAQGAALATRPRPDPTFS